MFQGLNSILEKSNERRSQFRAGILTCAVLLILPACLTNTIGNPAESQSNSSTVGKSNSLTGSSSLTEGATQADGSLDQCQLYSKNDPARAYCNACYETLVTLHCKTTPQITKISDCKDKDYKKLFPQQLNLCIERSLTSGSVCTKQCPGGQTLDSQCQCIKEPAVGSSLGDLLTDLGLEDAGAPIVQAVFPSGIYESVEKRVLGDDLVTPISSCSFSMSGSFAIKLIEQNRGGTTSQNNVRGSSLGTDVLDSTNKSIIGGIPAPVPVTINSSGYTSLITLTAKSGGEAEFDVTDSATDEVDFGATVLLAASRHTGGLPGRVSHTAGKTDPKPTLLPTLNSNADVDTKKWTQATFQNVDAVARDKWGNIYFSSNDPTIDPAFSSANTAAVLPATKDKIIKDNEYIFGSGFYPWILQKGLNNFIYVLCRHFGDLRCTTDDKLGTVIRVAGKTGGTAFGGGGGWWTTAALSTNIELGQIKGLAVDEYQNVFFSDFTNNAVGVACNPTSADGICANPGKIPAGTIGSNKARCLIGCKDGATEDDHFFIAAGSLHRPMGLDLDAYSGTKINIYVSELADNPTTTDGTDLDLSTYISEWCTYTAGATGPCKDAALDLDNYSVSNLVYGKKSSVQSTDLPARAGGTQISAHGFTDVKLTRYGNLYFTSLSDNKVFAYCNSTTNAQEPCDGTAGTSKELVSGKVYRIAGNGNLADSGGGGYALQASVARPYRLTLAKRWANDYSATSDFRDSNIVVVSHLEPRVKDLFVHDPDFNTDPAYDHLKDEADQTPQGNAVRVICGTNTGLSAGWCKDGLAYSINRITGLYGTASNATAGSLAIDTAYANLEAATYDLHKNLVVSSSLSRIPKHNKNSTDYNNDAIDGLGETFEDEKFLVDNALYTIPYYAVTKTAGAKYSFIDSSGKGSKYCLRLRVLTACFQNFNKFEDSGTWQKICHCRIAPPSGDAFWEYLGTNTSTAACP